MQYAFQPFYLEVCQNVKYRKRCMVSIVTMNLPQVYGSTLVKEMAANFTLLRQWWRRLIVSVSTEKNRLTSSHQRNSSITKCFDLLYDVFKLYGSSGGNRKYTWLQKTAGLTLCRMAHKVENLIFILLPLYITHRNNLTSIWGQDGPKQVITRLRNYIEAWRQLMTS